MNCNRCMPGRARRCWCRSTAKPHLTAQAELGLQSGIKTVPKVRNGDILRLAPGPATVIGEAPHGRIYKDGSLIGDFEEMGIGERLQAVFAGHVAVNVVLDARYDFAADPIVVPIGLPEFDDEGEHERYALSARSWGLSKASRAASARISPW